MKSYKEWLLTKESLLGTQNPGNPYQQNQQYHPFGQKANKTVNDYMQQLGRQNAPKFLAKLMQNRNFMGMKPNDPALLNAQVDDALANNILSTIGPYVR